jgi:hypothetical protein
MHRSIRGIAVSLVILGLAACAAAPAATTSPTVASGSVGASATAVASSAAATPSAAQGPTVDLTLTGAVKASINEPVGECMPGYDAAGKVSRFNYQVTGADVPALGTGLYISEGNQRDVTVKLLVSSNAGFINSRNLPNAVSTDHKSVTIDTDLGGSGTVHISGTVTCP